MKLSVCTILFALFTLNVFGQNWDNYIQLSHEITTETKAITGFEKLDISEDFKVFIRFSDKEEVKIEANENLHEFIQVEKEGETLRIYTKSYSSGGSTQKSGAEEKLVAYITAKNLSEIRGYEDVEIKLEDKLTTDDLAIYLNEDCTLKGKLDVDNLIVKIDEDSVLDIKGSAKTMDVKANEDCIIKSFDFVVGDLVIDLDDESEAKLTVNGKIDLKANEESSFHYRGDGDFVKKRVRGESEVRTW